MPAPSVPRPGRQRELVQAAANDRCRCSSRPIAVWRTPRFARPWIADVDAVPLQHFGAAVLGESESHCGIDQLLDIVDAREFTATGVIVQKPKAVFSSATGEPPANSVARRTASDSTVAVDRAELRSNARRKCRRARCRNSASSVFGFGVGHDEFDRDGHVGARARKNASRAGCRDARTRRSRETPTRHGCPIFFACSSSHSNKRDVTVRCGSRARIEPAICAFMSPPFHDAVAGIHALRPRRHTSSASCRAAHAYSRANQHICRRIVIATEPTTWPRDRDRSPQYSSLRSRQRDDLAREASRTSSARPGNRS